MNSREIADEKIRVGGHLVRIITLVRAAEKLASLIFATLVARTY